MKTNVSDATAPARAVRAIEMRGGEIVEFKGRDGARFAALDRHGAEVERFDGGVVEGLRASGRLRLRRFERGGVVWALEAGSGARAAYFDAAGA